jgi:hypothetical protein
VVAHFTDENHVRILSQCAAQSFRKRTCIDVDFALRDERLLVAMQKLDRVFDGDDVSAARGVDAIDHRRERCRFARTGRSGDEDQSTAFFGDLIDHGGRPSWAAVFV